MARIYTGTIVALTPKCNILSAWAGRPMRTATYLLVAIQPDHGARIHFETVSTSSDPDEGPLFGEAKKWFCDVVANDGRLARIARPEVGDRLTVQAEPVHRAGPVIVRNPKLLKLEKKP